MTYLRTTTAALAATVLAAAALALGAGSAHADGPEKDRDFRVAGAEVDFSVSKDDGRFEIEKNRRDTRGADTFKVRVKKIGGGAATRTIRMR